MIPDTKEKIIDSYTALSEYYGNDFNAFFYPFILSQVRKWKKQGKTLNRALEIGSGGGGLALEVARYVPDLCGVDLTAKMVEIATAKAAAAHSPAHFIQGDFQDADNLPQNNDLIYTLYVLAYAQNFETALRKIDSLLSPQGKVVLVEVAHMPSPAWLKKNKTLKRFVNTILQLLSVIRFFMSSLWFNNSVNIGSFWKAMSVFSKIEENPAWETLDDTRVHLPYPTFVQTIKRVWPTARIHRIMHGECLIIYEKGI